MDRKLGYIKNEYTDYYLSKTLSNINTLNGDVVEVILSLTEKISNIENIGTMELYYIYKNIFNEYLPNYDVRINNFYVNDNAEKKHFIIINYGEQYYSFNYTTNSFINVKYEDIYKNIKSNLIGLYYDEDFIREKKEVLV